MGKQNIRYIQVMYVLSLMLDLYNCQLQVSRNAKRRASSCEIHLPFLMNYSTHKPCMFLMPDDMD